MSRILLLALMLVSATVSARTADVPLQASIPFKAQQQKVLEDLRGEIYQEISNEDRAQVVAALERMALVIGEGTAQNLPEAQKVAVFNDQELVNATLTKARNDSRLVCRREKQIGSNMPTTQCLSVAERERQRRDSQTYVRNVQDGKIIKSNVD